MMVHLASSRNRHRVEVQWAEGQVHHDTRSTFFVLLAPQATEVPHEHLVQHAAVVDGAFQEALVVMDGQLQV